MAKATKKQDEIIGNLDAKNWVQKSDPLVLMRTVPFSLGELKILDTYISRINAGDDSRRTVIFTKEEYEHLMGLTCVDYRTLQKNTKGLLGKVVELEMPNKEYLQFVLFEQARYHKDEYGKPIIELTCTNLAKDLFFCIDKYHYFKYALENVIKLTRKASYLMYVYVWHNKYKKQWSIDLNELRDKVLDCKGQESYQEYKIFKNRVLEPAVKEVNAKTNCRFTYEPIKTGRKVTKIRFTVETVTDLIENYETDPLMKDQLTFDEIESDEEKEIDYGGGLANLLGKSALDNEFTPEQVRILQDLIIRIIPGTSKSKNMERCDYLIEKMHLLNYYKPKNRFEYLKNMLANELRD